MTADPPADADLEAFTVSALEFLRATLEPRPLGRPFVWGEGSDDVSFFEQRDLESELAEVETARAYRRQRFDAGFCWLAGPAEYGGRALHPAYDQRFRDLEGRFATPNMNVFTIGLGHVAPTILEHGTEAVKHAYLRDLHRGDRIACQLFSEPGAGSDLASLRTRAVRDGEGWVVQGQKVWTSCAHYSDIGELIARTDPSAPKHRGLTAFLVDMRAPGVEVRPLRQMTGGANFNEVFFDDVRIPDDHRLGDVDDGWRVAMTTLMSERASIGLSGGGGGADRLLPRVLEMARQFGLSSDPVVRQRLADLIIRFRVATMTAERLLGEQAADEMPGPEMSILKLLGARNSTALVDVLGALLGPKLIADTGEWGTFAWHQPVLGDQAGHIAGGSDQILLNILGERVLGLPKDPGIDTHSPFKDLPTR
jgi:alkylation response protein AidB-like acyl-CoA dehydrogenase